MSQETEFPADDFKLLTRKMRQQTADAFEILFERTGNPLCAWYVWVLFRDIEYREDPPEWVLQYIDRACVSFFDAVALEKVKNPAQRAGEAFQFKAAAKGDNPFEEFSRVFMSIKAIEHFSDQVAKGMKATPAYAAVGRIMNLEPAKVKRLILDFQALMGPQINEPGSGSNSPDHLK